MGFSTWNVFGCNVNQGEVEAIARALVRTGLRDDGYRYVNVDDCWAEPKRSAGAKLVASHKRFPSGMKALGNYLHTMGLEFGI